MIINCLKNIIRTSKPLLRFTLLVLLSGIVLYSCKSSEKATGNSHGKSQEGADNSAVFIDASKENIMGNYDEAAKLYKKALEINPQDDASMFELAKIYARKKDLSTSMEMARKAAETDPKNTYYLLFYGSLLQATEDYKGAIEVYKQLTDLKPDNPDYWNNLALAYLYAGKPDQAIEVYDLLEEKVGITEEYSLKKQKIYLQQKKVNKAINEVEKLIKAYPLESKYYAVLAEMCLENGMEDKALAAYQKIKEIDPENPYIHISLADFYKKQGKNELAFEELKKGFANPNLDIDSKIQVLMQYYTVNEIYDSLKDEAFTLAEILVETHPRDPKAYSMYGDFLYQDKQYENARDAFRKVITIDSSKYLVWEQLLFAESELQDTDAMLKESRKTMELFPEQPLPYLFAGGALYQKKKWNESIEVLEKGLSYVVNNDMLKSQYYAYLGDVYNQIGDHEKSDEAYENVLKINPDNDYVLNNYAYFLSLRNENLDKAAKMAKRATELRPNTPSNQDTYGWVLYQLGYYEEAKLWIGKALENGSENNPVILEHYGDTLWKLGQADKAVEYWEKAKAAGEGSDLLDKKVENKKLFE